jgi:hypothetical protein
MEKMRSKKRKVQCVDDVYSSDSFASQEIEQDSLNHSFVNLQNLSDSEIDSNDW